MCSTLWIIIYDSPNSTDKPLLKEWTTVILLPYNNTENTTFVNNLNQLFAVLPKI